MITKSPSNGIKYLALLRGINVGGNNIIKMTDLRACFENMGFFDVTTYIQSGNVVFTSTEKSQAKLIESIEKSLSKKFNYSSRIVVISQKQLQHTVEKAPKGYGKAPDKYRYDVIFLKAPLTTKEAIKQIETRENIDAASAGDDVLYFSRLISKATQSYLPKVIKLPIYKSMTIRNWNTTTKLLALMQNGNL